MAKRAKTGGRQKGTPNKDVLPLQALAEELDCDPFKIILLFAKGDFITLGIDEVTPDQRLKAALDAASYLHPKRKAIEHTGKDGGPMEGYMKLEQLIGGSMPPVKGK